MDPLTLIHMLQWDPARATSKLYQNTPLQIGWVQVVLVDPQGSGLYNKVTRGVMYAREEAENTRLRNPCDTITEGVGVNRTTANFEQVLDGSRLLG